MRENLAALAREAGDVLHIVGADLRETEWDAQTAARWSSKAARLERCWRRCGRPAAGAGRG
ncbi:hypothetical protein SALBM311S_09915 [Streptomyces alboniger]